MKRGRFLHTVTILLFILGLVSCSEQQPLLTPLADDAVILAFGDSLTYGSGVNSKTQSYPAMLAKLTGLQVINGGIPGEVTQLGLSRLADVLQEIDPNLVFYVMVAMILFENWVKNSCKII